MPKPHKLETRLANLVCVRGHHHEEVVWQVGHVASEESGEIVWTIESHELSCRECGAEIDHSRSEPL